MLTFDAAEHRYFWHGKPVPGVTSIISSVLGNPFERVPTPVLEHKRALGVSTHFACHLDDAGMLDETSVHPEVRPRLDAWRAFRRELQCEVICSERQLYHASIGYAGQPDRLMRLVVAGDRAVVDLKTGLPGPYAALQTAAYGELVDSEFGAEERPLRRFSLQALPSGRYKFTEYTNPGDWRDFLSCLNVLRIRERIAA